MACGCKKNNNQPVTVKLSEVKVPTPTQPAAVKQ